MPGTIVEPPPRLVPDTFPHPLPVIGVGDQAEAEGLALVVAASDEESDTSSLRPQGTRIIAGWPSMASPHSPNPVPNRRRLAVSTRVQDFRRPSGHDHPPATESLGVSSSWILVGLRREKARVTGPTLGCGSGRPCHHSRRRRAASFLPVGPMTSATDAGLGRSPDGSLEDDSLVRYGPGPQIGKKTVMIKHAMYAAVSLALLGLPQAATAQATTDHYKVKGVNGSVDCFMTDPTTGISTAIHVYSASSKSSSSRGALPPRRRALVSNTFNLMRTSTSSATAPSSSIRAVRPSQPRQEARFGHIDRLGHGVRLHQWG